MTATGNSLLINCPDCENQVSMRAVSCPKCGAPISATGAELRDEPGVKTTQATAKELKAQLVISGVVFWVGAALLLVEELRAIGIPIAIISLLFYLITKTRIWWHHG